MSLTSVACAEQACLLLTAYCFLCVNESHKRGMRRASQLTLTRTGIICTALLEHCSHSFCCCFLDLCLSLPRAKQNYSFNPYTSDQAKLRLQVAHKKNKSSELPYALKCKGTQMQTYIHTSTHTHTSVARDCNATSPMLCSMKALTNLLVDSNASPRCILNKAASLLVCILAVLSLDISVWISFLTFTSSASNLLRSVSPAFWSSLMPTFPNFSAGAANVCPCQHISGKEKGNRFRCDAPPKTIHGDASPQCSLCHELPLRAVSLCCK